MPILYIALAIVLLLAGAGYFMTRTAYYPHRYSPAETVNMEIAQGKIADLD